MVLLVPYLPLALPAPRFGELSRNAAIEPGVGRFLLLVERKSRDLESVEDVSKIKRGDLSDRLDRFRFSARVARSASPGHLG